MQVRELINDTPLIHEAIQRDDISSLYTSLKGLFNYLSELRTADAVKDSEIFFVEELIGRVLFYLAEWNGISTVAGKLFLQGTVDTRGEVLRLAAPIYDLLDAKKFPPKSVPLIGVVGPIASGKGTVGKIVGEIFEAMHLPLSDRLREYASGKGSVAPHSRTALREVNDELKPRFGNPVFVRWTLDMARRLAAIYNQGVMSFDGFRSLEEAKLFKDNGGILIAITASPDTRFERLVSRKRGADDFDREKFDLSDGIEQAWIKPIIEIADVVISNEGSEQEATALLLQQFKMGSVLLRLF